MDNDMKPPRVSRISWLTIVLAALAVLTFAMSPEGTLQYPIPYGVMRAVSSSPMPPSVMMESGGSGFAPAVDVSVMNAPRGMMAPDYYPYPGPQYGGVPATDTRELLKVSYNAAMRTRDVQGLTRRVETTVRGYDGRVDSESSSPESGYVSFVVPVSKYDAFRTELEGLVGSRFLTINISSQNMLPQKQSIEEWQGQVEKSLAELQSERKQAIASHNSKVRSLQGEIDTNASVQASLRAEVTNDPARQAAIISQLNQLSVEASSLKSRLNSENSNYANIITSFDAQIKYTNESLEGVKQQDQDLLDTVATVNGTVSIQWIGLWEIARLYLPGYWIPAIFAALAFLSYLRDRRRLGISLQATS